MQKEETKWCVCHELNGAPRSGGAPRASEPLRHFTGAGDRPVAAQDPVRWRMGCCSTASGLDFAPRNFAEMEREEPKKEINVASSQWIQPPGGVSTEIQFE